MAKIYFHKLAFNSPIRFKDSNIRFEPVGGNTGVKMLDDAVGEQAEELAFLNQLADTKTRGVSRISEEIYNEKKNNRASATSRSRQNAFGSVRILEPRDSSPIKAQPAQSAAAPAVPSAAAGAAEPARIPVVPGLEAESGAPAFTPALRKRSVASAIFEG